jgi:predicted metallopeptidase
MIEYERDAEIEMAAADIVAKLGMRHIDLSRLVCMRSRGSKSRRVLARCHVMPRIMQKALGAGAVYIIEVVSENFDRLSGADRTKTMIHELMHIPATFGGGFRHHGNHVTRKNVEMMYRMYAERQHFLRPTQTHPQRETRQAQ